VLRRKSLEEKLRDGGGRSARATILKAKKRWYSSGMSSNLGSVQYYRLKLRVEPDGEPAFEADADANSNYLGILFEEGATLRVLYDPEDHSEVAVDQQAGVAEMLEEAKAAKDPDTGSVAHTASDPIDKLKELADLHDRGALTDAEFETQKAKLLGS
jgi:hypothetical protein